MADILQPWQVLLAAFAGWINRHQQAAIDYLREENRILREHLEKRRLRLTDDRGADWRSPARCSAGKP